MKTYQFLLFLLFQQISSLCSAQSNIPTQNFESAVNFNTSAIPQNLGGFLSNPAALGFTNKAAIGCYQQVFLQLPQVQGNAIYFQSQRKYKIGGAWQQFGNNHFKIWQPNLCLATQINPQLAIGIQMNFLGIPKEWGGRHWQPSTSLGICWQYLPKLHLGLSIHQLLAKEKKINLSCTWLCTPNFSWSIAIQKQLNFPQTIQTAFRYEVLKNYKAHLAFGLFPMRNAVGLEFPIKKSILALAAIHQEWLGWQSAISLQYPIK